MRRIFARSVLMVVAGIIIIWIEISAGESLEGAVGQLVYFTLVCAACYGFALLCHWSGWFDI